MLMAEQHIPLCRALIRILRHGAFYGITDDTAGEYVSVWPH